MAKLESSLENAFNDKAAKCRFISIKLVALSKRGFPDRTVIGKGSHVFFVELKRKGEKPKPHQTYWIKLLRKCGFRVYVCDTPEQADAIFIKEKGIQEREAKMERS